MTHQDRITAIQIGHEIETFMQQPIMARGLEEFEALCWARWKATRVDETAEREAIFMELQGMHSFVEHLTAPVHDATLAQNENKSEQYTRELG